MAWIVIGAWLAALVVALVVLGFCAYEIVWKTRRLRANLEQLNEVADRLEDLQHGLAETRARVAASGLG